MRKEVELFEGDDERKVEAKTDSSRNAEGERKRFMTKKNIEEKHPIIQAHLDNILVEIIGY